MEPYVCWSCPVDDFSDWTYHGIIYTGKEDTRNDGTMYMYAPDVIKHKDKYYLYYGLSENKVISVAVSDVPYGPFVFYGHVKHEDGTLLGLKDGDPMQFDPGLFEDEDGTIYLYTGFSVTEAVQERIRKKANNMNLVLNTMGNYVVELQDDMLTMKSDIKNLIPGESNGKGTEYEGHEFYEASSMRKYNGMYYMIYSSTQGHELCYAMSQYPDKDFIYKGVLHSNGNIGIDTEAQYYFANNHGSLVEINGHYYIFGHRHTNHHQFSRQGVAEEIFMNEDGTFNQAEMTSCGLNGKPLKGTGDYPAYIACVLKSKDGAIQSSLIHDDNRTNHPAITQESLENKDAYIVNIQDGTVIGFKYFELNGLNELSLEVKSSNDGYFEIYADEVCIGMIELNACMEWKIYSGKTKMVYGKKALYLVFKGNGSVCLRSISLTV
ncbi:MAG: family 43 glycosylhydrolase [Holdemanella sp.]|nr:family 43 glycosylhydrolase [Holdemanella sp.]